MTVRDDVIGVLTGRATDGYPCFSGLVNVTKAGLDDLGLTLAEVHTDGAKMAAAAATSHRLFGFGSAVVPLDICVEAEIVGARVDFGGPDEYRLPKVDQPLASSAGDLDTVVPTGLAATARISTVAEAIGILKGEVGDGAAVGAWVPGPFTLATLLIDLPTLLGETRTDPDAVATVLDRLTEVLTGSAAAYREAGADFITVHEMGGSPGFIGPAPFETLVLPRLKHLLGGMAAPRVLSVCGRTDHAVDLLAEAGADALSVDQLNSVAASRAVLGPDAVILGNIDPVGVLGGGTGEEVKSAVAGAIAAGVDAVWPGCDLLAETPLENLSIMMDEAAGHRRGNAEGEAER
jgi:[methyl-Co(III) methanol-specific corrinoid protein]:coenzyme M methyltransferase